MRVGTLQEGQKLEVVGVLQGQILGAVDGNIDAAITKRLLQLRGEDPLPLVGQQRTTLVTVGVGCDDGDLDLLVGKAIEIRLAHQLRLLQRKP